MKGRSFRLACEREEIPMVDRLLEEEGYEVRRLPFDERARIAVSGPRALGSSVAAFFGLIYIQDPTSMLPPLILGPHEGEAVLDLCAAPGGKSGILSYQVGPSGLVLANEPAPKRLAVLRSNLHLQECFNTITASYPGERFPQAGPLTGILIDAPCSGWGTAEKNPRVLTLWTEEKTKTLIALQRRLLARAFELLSPGGRLVYSTCTTHVRENEEQVEWAVRELGAEVDSLPGVEGFANETSGAQGGLRIHGAEYGGQSFFLALLRKPGSPSREVTPKGSGEPGKETAARESEAGKWLESLGLDAGSLPQGRLRREKGEIRLAPLRGEEVMPSGSAWRGRYLGTEHKKGVRLTARLRSALPPPDRGRGLDVEDVATLRHLIAGQSFSVQASGRSLPLYWRGLPLVLLTVKKGRCLFAEKV